MKKRMIVCLMLSALTLGTLCGCGSAKTKESSVQEKSVVSQAESSEKESSAEESVESSAEPSLISSPSKPDVVRVEAKVWSADDLKALIEKSKIENMTVSTYEYVPVDGSDTLYCTTAEITITGLFDDLLTLSNYLANQEKNNIYIDSFSLSLDYNDDVNMTVKVINPYPAGEGADTDEVRDYIGIRWNSVDKKAAIAAFVDENANYYLQTAQCDFTPAEDGSITFLAGIDFSTYNGFVAYRYKLGNSQNFEMSDNAAVTEKSDYYGDKPFHADVILTSNKFNR